MDRSLRWRTISLGGLLIFCVCMLLPSFVPKDSLPGWFSGLFDKKINYGLDLQGGVHLTYSIALDRAVDDKASEIKRDLDTRFEDKEWKGQVTVTTRSPPVGTVVVKMKDPAKKAEIEKLVLADYKDVADTVPCPPGEAAGTLCFQVKTSYADSIRKEALHSAVLTIRDRIDERGIAEPSVVEKGDDIIVELPGLEEEAAARVRQLIARTAKLEFKMVKDGSPFMENLFAYVNGDENRRIAGDPDAAGQEIKAEPDSWTSEENNQRHKDWYLYAHDQDRSITIAKAKTIGCWHKGLEVKDGKVRCTVSGKVILQDYLTSLLAKDAKKWKVPEGDQIGYERVTPEASAKDRRPYWRTWYLDRTVRLSGSAVTQAVVNWDPNTAKPVVDVTFNRYGGHVFGDLTANNVGHKMAIILDEKINSAPVINGPIRGGQAVITMGGADPDHMQAEAEDLVSVLKTGSLPAPLQEESYAQVGPSLGRDAIQRAKWSFVVGIMLVVVIMLGIYKWSGWIAIAAVGVNVAMMMTAMTMFGATLTLPGIAALVLTVGMGVDGNILIYERIRDELMLGKSVRGAVDVGFSRAFTAILDGQMTTAAAGWVLLQYGSGPIKGFAVMLLVGIGTTLFCCTVVTRYFFDLVASRKKGSTASTISI